MRHHTNCQTYNLHTKKQKQVKLFRGTNMFDHIPLSHNWQKAKLVLVYLIFLYYENNVSLKYQS